MLVSNNFFVISFHSLEGVKHEMGIIISEASKCRRHEHQVQDVLSGFFRYRGPPQ